MMARVKIAAVSYLNTIPFLYGINHAESKSLHAQLLLSPPAGCAEVFRNGDVDIALIPIAEIPTIENIKIIGNHCIGALDKVRTVVMLSNTPVDRIKRIFLDSHSRTSVALVRIIARELWGINVEWLPLNDFSQVAKDPEAGYVLIGDKVFDWETKFIYNYDLAHEWHTLTGLPFAFAAWVAHKDINDQTIVELERMLDYGVAHIEESVIEDGRINSEIGIDYLKHNIDFRLDPPKREAMELFWKKHREDAPKINPG